MGSCGSKAKPISAEDINENKPDEEGAVEEKDPTPVDKDGEEIKEDNKPPAEYPEDYETDEEMISSPDARPRRFRIQVFEKRQKDIPCRSLPIPVVEDKEGVLAIADARCKCIESFEVSSLGQLS